MKAVEFIKKFGWDFSKEFSKKGYELSETYPNDIAIGFIDDLKRLVESWDLIQSKGGLENAKEDKLLANELGFGFKGLAQAIADVESVELS